MYLKITPEMWAGMSSKITSAINYASEYADVIAVDASWSGNVTVQIMPRAGEDCFTLLSAMGGDWSADKSSPPHLSRVFCGVRLNVIADTSVDEVYTARRPVIDWSDPERDA